MKNEPAFPMYNELGNLHATGLTKREYFAARAMEAIIEKGIHMDAARIIAVAELAVRHADALLKALEE